MTDDRSDHRLTLPQVTLIAATSVNVAATVHAIKASLSKAEFGACKLLTDVRPAGNLDGIEWVPIPRLGSAKAYSNFILSALADYVTTSHCLIVQWDGHIVDANRWTADFLDYDYIGASWPQFADGHNIGNGGFSLRSHRLLEMCRMAEFDSSHPEDIAIGRINRDWLEQQALRFAPAALADIFSAERAGHLGNTFGYHGVWHMPDILGPEAFWNIYCTLDDRTSVRYDFYALMKQLSVGRGGTRRAVKLAIDQMTETFRKKGTCLE